LMHRVHTNRPHAGALLKRMGLHQVYLKKNDIGSEKEKKKSESLAKNEGGDG